MIFRNRIPEKCFLLKCRQLTSSEKLQNKENEDHARGERERVGGGEERWLKQCMHI
jgi:hypothetical protein